MSLREAAQAALESLAGYRREMNEHQPCDAEIALRDALAEAAKAEAEKAEAAKAEPVAWRIRPQFSAPWSLSDDGYYASCKKSQGYQVAPLYTHSPAALPESESLLRTLHEIAEEWAGAECGQPVTAQEAYAIQLARRMYGIAAEAIAAARGKG